jgi:hypothetical protein
MDVPKFGGRLSRDDGIDGGEWTRVRMNARVVD